jgi:hypothetical protein
MKKNVKSALLVLGGLVGGYFAFTQGRKLLKEKPLDFWLREAETFASAVHAMTLARANQAKNLTKYHAENIAAKFRKETDDTNY